MGKQMGSDNNRIKAREQAFCLCFSAELAKEKPEEIIDAYSELEQPLEFACELARGCVNNAEKCDEIISRYLKNWKLSRIPKVSKTLLRLAVYQLVFCPDNTSGENPVGIIINDAVRLAKIYATDEDAAFINGVLGSVAKALESGSLTAESEKTDE